MSWMVGVFMRALDGNFGDKMYNKNHNKNLNPPPLPPPISPRISFSNDFAESAANHHHYHHHHNHKRDNPSPVSSDFEFSVSNYSMISADELFSKGRLLPFKDTCSKTTLREELLSGHDEDETVSIRPPKGSNRWKGFLGLRKSNIGSKKLDKGDGSRLGSVHESKSTHQEQLNEGSSEGM